MNINVALIGQSVAFLIFVLFCTKFVWPPVIAALQERQKGITSGLDAASCAVRGPELAHEKAGQQLHGAKAQAAKIIEQARKHTNQIVDETRGQARTGNRRLKVQAQVEIERELNNVKDALRAQAGALAVTGTEKILGASIDANVRGQLVSKLAARI